MDNCRHSPQCQCFKRIAELEKQLADFRNRDFVKHTYKLEKREAVLRKALRELLLAIDSYNLSWEHTAIPRARAALEVK